MCDLHTIQQIAFWTSVGFNVILGIALVGLTGVLVGLVHQLPDG